MHKWLYSQDHLLFFVLFASRNSGTPPTSRNYSKPHLPSYLPTYLPTYIKRKTIKRKPLYTNDILFKQETNKSFLNTNLASHYTMHFPNISLSLSLSLVCVCTCARVWVCVLDSYACTWRSMKPPCRRPPCVVFSPSFAIGIITIHHYALTRTVSRLYQIFYPRNCSAIGPPCSPVRAVVWPPLPVSPKTKQNNNDNEQFQSASRVCGAFPPSLSVDSSILSLR